MLALASVCFASCISLEDQFSPATDAQAVSVMASVADFNKVDVSTRALEEEESEVHELTMVIYASDGNIVGKPVNLSGGNSIFMIDTKNKQIIDGDNNVIAITNDQSLLDACSIYMVANCSHILEDETINTRDQLLAVDIPVTAIGIPEYGIPMMGYQAGFDLSSDRAAGTSTVANIVMDKLYSKVNVRFQINADQVINTPSFNLLGWTVSNIPANVRLGEPAETRETANASGAILETTKSSTTLSVGNPTIMHSESAINPDYFQFTFYVPEHKVNPLGTVTYPTGIPDSEKQRYKPLLCTDTQKPMYVTVNGSYTDHHGQVREVEYSLYLGQNNTDNFHILRNQEINNIITIKGLTNSKDAIDWVPDGGEDNISVDHRVEITSQKGYSIAMEREALLDSHFEVRPMDVFVSTGGKVVVTVNSDDAETDDDWLRIEKSFGGDDSNDTAENSTYIQGVGVRKYFTTDLVTNTLASAGRQVTVNAGDNSRIWLYFDENTNVYDKTLNEGADPKHRDITITVDYYADANSSDITETQTFSFRQMNLWRVRDVTNTRYYDIEYHEEYLYNYVSNDNYGKTTDGMVWGLDGITFSGNMGDDLKTQAVVIDATGWSQNIIQNIIDAASPFYDFYLPREAAEISSSLSVPNNEYAGRRFSNAIIDSDVDGSGTGYSAISLMQRELNDDPTSAIEYCLNKNRRNAQGVVASDSRDWYLPAIDEMEEIMVGGYTDFAVFQNKMYWSCQPAFHKNHLLYSSTFISEQDFKGDYYYENADYARATNALYKGIDVNGNDTYTYAGSGVVNDGYYQSLEISFFESGDSETTRVTIPSEGRTIRYWDGTRNWIMLPVYTDIHLNQVKYDVGYNSRADINRVRCVRNSGLVSELNSTN